MNLSTIKEIKKQFSLPGIMVGLFLIFGFFVTYYVLNDQYLLFHTIVESVVTLIGFSIFIISVNTFRYARHGYFLFIGMSFFFYSILNFFHTISYKGLNLLNVDPNIPTQLWIAERFLLAIFFLIATYFLRAKFKFSCYLGAITFLTLSTAGVLLSILYFKNFPTAYIDGIGLTQFKITSEHIISALFVLNMIVYHVQRKYLDEVANFYILSALLFSLFAELAFTLYVDVYGLLNMIGHLFIFISFMFINAVFIRKTLNEPYSTIFIELAKANKKLEELAVTDGLTGLLNRRAALEKIVDEFKKKRRYGGNFSIIMLDLDYFKETNDDFGHAAGDKVLKEFGKTLIQCVREQDVVGRLGGDEFVICPLEADSSDCQRITAKIKQSLDKKRVEIEGYRRGIKIEFTTGYYSCNPKEQDSHIQPENIINLADTLLLENKKIKKRVLKENTKNKIVDIIDIPRKIKLKMP